MDLEVKGWVDPESGFPPPPQADVCERWAVLASIVEPSHTVDQLAAMNEWCVVVVGDHNGEFACVPLLFCCTITG